ncbi:serine/threonine-protein phosphatase [Azospirillum brasilense]|uniref:Protein phosphatase 2C domain-containing protein n=1 Tax=Azospirillum brasilense TaxID=192 RepID=A0A0P0F413_AZOBR|nr:MULTISPECIES: protein phosphatase 2C domain-containing protein [Azospirillum]ALJ35341.1 protein phosphatase [Azospirillum brasilense]MDW7555118.1 protein phosphatase 2C domain-containing protein [Azospirillum brasilense]MDW7594895.1 protein phosphatase 2C domain-containing protein [Azospirillum brasilense]MDW7629890.1 protein phosphatase 2C domain-containing protein [Azospirillum brasilense]MDX5954049.1 protein phosphatase 2C domain-containing protein [Azospirillum brasilense]
MHSALIDMIAVGQTDVGRVRSRNEDSFHLDPARGLAVICDGMGGHAGGDIASRTAVEVVAAVIAAQDRAEEGRTPSQAEEERAAADAASMVRSAVVAANRRINALNRQRGFAEGRGMGTTLVGLWRVPGTDRVIVFHAGDSRLYRLRGGELRLLTRDHSLYQVWLDNGRRGQAPHRNIIVRALGTGEQVEPEIAVHDLQPDDLYLLCSDGLTGIVPEGVIQRILTQQPPLTGEDACARLIALANGAGGPDNITLILARFVRLPP